MQQPITIVAKLKVARCDVWSFFIEATGCLHTYVRTYSNNLWRLSYLEEEVEVVVVVPLTVIR